MINRPRGIRRGAMAALASTTLALAACAGGTTDGKGSSRPSAAGSSLSFPSTSSGPTDGAPSGTPSSGNTSVTPSVGNIAQAACADITSLMKVNNEFDGIGSDVGKGRILVASLQQVAVKLSQDAPDDLSSAATTYQGAVETLKSYVDKATSIDELHSESSSDPTLRAALSELSSSGKQIDTWRSANC